MEKYLVFEFVLKLFLQGLTLGLGVSLVTWLLGFGLKLIINTFTSILK